MRILIADDHTLFRDSLRALMASHDHEIVGEAREGREAVELARLKLFEAIAGVTSNRKLAQRLGVTENTIKFHVRNILDKLHLHNRTQVVGFALRHGMVAPPGGA